MTNVFLATVVFYFGTCVAPALISAKDDTLNFVGVLIFLVLFYMFVCVLLALLEKMGILETQIKPTAPATRPLPKQGWSELKKKKRKK